MLNTHCDDKCEYTIYKIQICIYIFFIWYLYYAINSHSHKRGEKEKSVDIFTSLHFTVDCLPLSFTCLFCFFAQLDKCQYCLYIKTHHERNDDRSDFQTSCLWVNIYLYVFWWFFFSLTRMNVYHSHRENCAWLSSELFNLSKMIEPGINEMKKKKRYRSDNT